MIIYLVVLSIPFTFLGISYDVKIEYIVIPQGGENEVTILLHYKLLYLTTYANMKVKSIPLVGKFTTKPLAPTNIKVGPGPHEVTWTKSATPSVG